MSADPGGALLGRLDGLTQALRAGNFAALAPEAEAIVALAEHLPADSVPQPMLAAIAAAAERNRGLLASALRGVRAATARGREIAAAEAGLRTYDNQGRGSLIGADAAGTPTRF
jgi:hypothetical protein